MAREAPLVSQYLERISRGAVDKYRVLFRTYVRHRQGVYALYKGEKLYYVGLAGDLRWRLHQHLADDARPICWRITAAETRASSQDLTRF
jgi:hypothetical protein